MTVHLQNQTITTPQQNLMGQITIGSRVVVAPNTAHSKYAVDPKTGVQPIVPSITFAKVLEMHINSKRVTVTLDNGFEYDLHTGMQHNNRETYIVCEA